MNKQFTHEISVIVPIFNEQDTVAGVVEFLLSTSLFIEVICIDDGSIDRSIERLQHLGDRITTIDNQINRGKGFSLARGIERARGDLETARAPPNAWAGECLSKYRLKV